jgi:hypothetical protein
VSRIYFHSPSLEAEVPGAERAHMGILTQRIGQSIADAYLIRRVNEWATVSLYEGLLSVDDISDDKLEAMARRRFHHDPDYSGAYAIAYRGHGIGAWDLSLNTCLRVGSPTVQLLARIHAQCEIHAWVDGPNRAWLADLIEAGMRDGTFRETSLDYTDYHGQPIGWRPVMAMLRARDDEPVVTSYSVCDQFPNPGASTWMPAWPEGVAREWSALSEGQQAARSARQDAWYDLPDEEQWRHGMDYLQSGTGHLELLPEQFGDGAYHFGHGLSWLDLDAGDAEDHVRHAFGIDERRVKP